MRGFDDRKFIDAAVHAVRELLASAAERSVGASRTADEVPPTLGHIDEFDDLADFRDRSWPLIAERVGRVAEAFGVADDVEEVLLGLTTLVYSYPSFAVACRVLGATSRSAQLTAGLAGALIESSGLCDDRVVSAVSPGSVLVSQSVLRVAPASESGARTIALNDVVARFVTGDDQPPASLVGMLDEHPICLTDSQAEEIVGRIDAAGTHLHVVNRGGDAGLEAAAGALVMAQLSPMVVTMAGCEPTHSLGAVEDALVYAALAGRGLIIDLTSTDHHGNTWLFGRMSLARVRTISVSTESPAPCCGIVAIHRARQVDLLTRQELWRILGEAAGVDIAPHLHQLSAFVVTPRVMTTTMSRVAAEAPTASGVGGALIRAVLRELPRTVGSTVEMVTDARLADLVLPIEVRDELDDFLSFSVQRTSLTDHDSHTVPVASLLLAGSPGTGKTSCARALSAELGVPLLTVELSRVVDKYVGETERRLEDIFTRAEADGCLLFFDEADSLFGARAGVKDARDRYANQQVSYLLQRLEKYAGVCVLATNFLGNIDKAFIRRLSYVITLKTVDADARFDIWRRHLGDAALVGDDFLGWLARDNELTPAEIVAVCRRSQTRAARLGHDLDHEVVSHCLRKEYGKSGRMPPTQTRWTEKKT